MADLTGWQDVVRVGSWSRARFVALTKGMHRKRPADT